MNRRPLQTPIEDLRKKISEELSSSKDARYIHRVTIVSLFIEGVSLETLSNGAHYTKEQISRWVKSADTNGLESLIDCDRPGRPNKLSSEQIAEIDIALQNDPNKSGYNVWDGPSLSAYIKKTYNIDYSVRQCQRLFKSLGYSKIRPRKFPSKGNENGDLRVDFKKKLRK